MNPTLTEAVTPEDLEKARRDFRRMLRKKRLSPQWIEEHAEDLLAQAQVEYAAKLAKGEPARSVVGWLVNGAWWRAQDLLESEGRRPPTSSIEAAFHLADDSELSPEHLALRHDRAATLRRALCELPEKDRHLLTLVYFDGLSIRAAGRKVGWQKSAADRHHGEALQQLRLLLGDDRSVLSPAMLGPTAWIALEAEGSATLARATRLLVVPLQRTLAELAELASGAAQRMAGLWRRLFPLADPAAAAAGSGGGRALGACGVAAATLLCGAAAGGVVPAALSHSHPAKPKAGPSTYRAPLPEPRWSPAAPAADRAAQAAVPDAPTPRTSAQELRTDKPAQVNAGTRRTGEVPKGQPTPVAREFGAEAAVTPQPTGTTGVGTASRPSGAASSRETASAGSTPESAAAAGSSPKAGSGSSSGSKSGAEFGF